MNRIIPMTPARLKVLRRWWVWTHYHGAQPSYRELMVFTGLRSTNSVSEQLARLVRDGWMRKDPSGQQRALSITPKGLALLHGAEPPMVVVPVVGRQVRDPAVLSP